jgi:hypothetical protein
MPMIASCGMRRLAMHARHGEDPCADDRPERGDLRQREVDEDHAALDDVHAEVGVNAGENQSGQKRQIEKRKNVSHLASRVGSPPLHTSSLSIGRATMA